MNIFITVNKQRMHLTSNNRSYVAGTQEFILFNFVLSNDWDNLTTFAQFIQDGKPYNVYLDSDNTAYLPPEIHKGTCTLALKGTKGNTIAVTEPLQLTLSENPIQSDASSTEITLTLYEQLVNKVDSLLEDDSLIIQTTEKTLQEFLEEGRFAAMSISDGSINVKKLSSDAIATNDEIKEYLALS